MSYKEKKSNPLIPSVQFHLRKLFKSDRGGIKLMRFTCLCDINLQVRNDFDEQHLTRLQLLAISTFVDVSIQLPSLNPNIRKNL